MKRILHAVYFLSLLALVGLATEPSAKVASDLQDKGWTFHHEVEELPDLEWPQLGQAYLGRMQWEDLGAGEAPAAGNRLVVAPWSGEVASGVLGQLGFESIQGIEVGGAKVEAGLGLIILAPDPDGEGRLALFTGSDGAAVYKTMTVSTNLEATGWFVVDQGRILRSGVWPDLGELSFKLDVPVVRRLDLEFFDLRNRYRAHSRDEMALVMARSFAGEQDTFEAALGAVDLFAFHRQLLAQSAKVLDRTEAAFDSPAAAIEVAVVEARLTKLLGKRLGPAPLITFLVADPVGTNARTFGPDPVTGRPRILINVAAHVDSEALALSVAHELVHTHQVSSGETLGQKAVAEGVAVFLSGLAVPGNTDAQLLIWTDQDLVAAESKKAAILEEFSAVMGRNWSDMGDWLILGRTLQAVPDAPDRCAYWVGFLGARAWFESNPKAGPAGLLQAPFGDILGSLGL